MPVALRSLSRKPKPRQKPESDPRFAKIVEDLKRKSAKVKQHPTPKQKAAEAQAAAKGPPNERAAGGKAKQVDKIKEAKTKKPESDSFLSLLRAEIEKAMPKTLGDTEKFMKGGDASSLKGSLKGNVNQQKQEATGDVSSASKEPPGEAGEAKQSTPIPNEPQPPSPDVDAAAGMPAPKTAADVSLQDSKQDTDAAMADAEVTPTQLKKANDPRFSAVLTAKDSVGKQADAAPAAFRARERGVLTSAGAQAKAASRKGAGAMLGSKAKSKSAVQLRQEAAKKKDELERKKVADDIEAIYNRTKTNVENKLASLETEVGAMFDTGTDAALSAMKSYVEERIFNYKLERYLSIPGVGAARWVADQFTGLPEEVNAFYVEGRNIFTRLMDALVVRVADLVEKRLAEAKAMVADGQNEIKLYVSNLAPNLRSVGESAQKEIDGRFKELEQGIENKKNELAQALAQKYKEASDKADKALKEIQDANKGLVQAFVEKLGEIIKVLAEFKDKLMALLKKGADTIKLILADPIGFLSNLIGAIKQGFNQFKANIKSWLVKGLIGWLFGALASAGVTPPADFSLASIFKLVMQILGITFENMRAKAVKLLGPTAVTVIEKLVEYVKTFIAGGPAKLWEQVKGDLSNLKEMVLGAIRDMIIETVIKAAVTKLLSMFNPAGAIVQAVLAIYNTVMFVIEQAAQIMSFVDAIVNSVSAIAQGAIGAAATKVEQALGAAIPLVIGFFARLIGLGDIPKRATATVKKVQGVIDAAIDKFLGKAIAFVKKMMGKLGGKERTPEEKKKDLERAGRELKPKVKALMAKGVPPIILKARLALWKVQYKLTTLELRGRELVATINPELTLAEGWTFEDNQVFLVIDKIAKEMVKEAQKERAKENRENKKKGVPPLAPVTTPSGQTLQQVDIRQRSAPAAGVVALGAGQQRVIVGQTVGGKEVAFEHGFEQAPYQMGPFPWRGIGPGGGAKGRKYDELVAALAGKPTGDWLKMLATGKPLPKEAEPHAGDLAELYGLMMAKEPSHGGGANRRDLAYSMMAIDLASGPGGKPIDQIVGKTGIHPAAFGEAQMGAAIVAQDMKGTRGIGALTKKEAEASDKRRERERETLKAWFEKHKKDLPLFPKDQKPTLADVETFVRSKLKEIFKR
ncbi:MAG TPA: hypothetical protein VEX70_16095 [Pyrinomonadaceae bacterium]|nr:hypothetical protein [Pyrinomonadaceae bacterium]